MKTEVRFDRLGIMAAHLEKGELGHLVFDFACFNRDYDDIGGQILPKPYSCGTNGCAIGECPIVWPGDWTFDRWGDPTLASAPFLTESEAAERWFGVTFRQYAHLFEPNEQQPHVFGGKTLVGNATCHEVAANIRAFIEKMQN